MHQCVSLPDGYILDPDRANQFWSAGIRICSRGRKHQYGDGFGEAREKYDDVFGEAQEKYGDVFGEARE